METNGGRSELATSYTPTVFKAANNRDIIIPGVALKNKESRI
jgi:hypothetical protein